MTPILENCILGTDLDADNYNIKNVLAFDPVPSGLALSTDPALTDARVPLDGSVTNASVAAGAAIVQSKLNLNGDIPGTWLGSTATTAAQGNLAEYLSNKGQPNGYAELDGSGKVPAAQLPTAVGAGTVTSVGLTMPAEFGVTGSPVTGAGTLAVAWNSVADQSWFGNKSGGSAAPQFYSTALPASLIPTLDASIVTTGTFPAARLPIAVGLGGSHAPGAVPDPGDGTGGALATDYLARDMTYKPAPTIGPTYQPTVTTPVINVSPNLTGAVTVTITEPIKSNIFFSTTSGATGFAEFPSTGYYSLAAGSSIWVYAAAAGYTNSAQATYTNSNPP